MQNIQIHKNGIPVIADTTIPIGPLYVRWKKGLPLDELLRPYPWLEQVRLHAALLEWDKIVHG